MVTPGQPNTPTIPPIVPNIPLNLSAPLDGVFEGGGALGTAYVGALRLLEDSNLRFARVAGNSAGAITAAMVAVGFTAREIEALSSAFNGTGAALPKSLTKLGIVQPIKFDDFLDLPTVASISKENKRKTVLWHALNGTVLDVIGATEIPIPTQAATVDACVKEIFKNNLFKAAIQAVGLTPALKGALDIA